MKTLSLLILLSMIICSCSIRYGETPLSERDPNYTYVNIGGKNRTIIYDKYGNPTGYMERE